MESIYRRKQVKAQWKMRRVRMLERICIVALVSAMFYSGANGQVFAGANWLSGLTENIDALNRNIQQNVQQLNQRITETVRGNLAQASQLAENLKKEQAAGGLQHAIGGNNVVLSYNDGTKIVHSGRTSDGKLFVRESLDRIVGDTLRHMDRIYDPAANVSRVYGYTLDLKDPNAKPVPIQDNA